MKRTKIILIILCVTFVVSGCQNGGANNINNIMKEKVTFADPAFEVMVRNSIGKLGGDITIEDLSYIKYISADMSDTNFSYSSNPESEDILSVSTRWDLRTIEDLKYFVNLEALQISDFDVSNIDFIKSMTNLKYLEISGITPTLNALSSTPNIKVLIINGLSVGNDDYSILAKLKKLQRLGISPKAYNELPNKVIKALEKNDVEIIK